MIKHVTSLTDIFLPYIHPDSYLEAIQLFHGEIPSANYCRNTMLKDLFSAFSIFSAVDFIHANEKEDLMTRFSSNNFTDRHASLLQVPASATSLILP